MGHLGRDGPSPCSGSQPCLVRPVLLKPEPRVPLLDLMVPNSASSSRGPFTASLLWPMPVGPHSLTWKPSTRPPFSPQSGVWHPLCSPELSLLTSAVRGSGPPAHGVRHVSDTALSCVGVLVHESSRRSGLLQSLFHRTRGLEKPEELLPHREGV